MPRLKALNPDEVSGKTKELFTAIHGQLGVVPNMMRTMGNSPALLEGSLNLSKSLAGGSLGGKTATLISLVVAENNRCNYCLSAHSYIGANLQKIDEATMSAARKGNATDTKTDAILKFAKVLVNDRGQASDSDMQALQSAGVSQGEIAEIIGHVGLNILTNYFNNIVKTEIDFPLVRSEQVATA
jgi:uncharacterized peroxidase-related enzyme